MLATAHRLMGSPNAAAVVTVTSDDSLSLGALGACITDSCCSCPHRRGARPREAPGGNEDEMMKNMTSILPNGPADRPPSCCETAQAAGSTCCLKM